MLFINAEIYDNDFIRRKYDMRVEDGIITELGPRASINALENEEVIDLQGKVIVPGMLDNHVHGALGKDVMDGEFESLETISRYLASKGVTSFLPTTMTMGVEHLKPVFAIQEQLSGAEMLGFHMEGPFINVEKKGAQNEEYVRPATVEEMQIYGEDANIKIITLAPETPNALEFISAMKERTVLSLGHSSATYEEAKAAIEAGATSVTHCFNAMNPLHHRSPGIIGAAVQAGIYGELIADGLHIHPAVVYCNYKMFGAERMILVSDSLRAAGLGDGEYEFGGQAMYVENNVARVGSGALAGGTSNTWNNVRNCYKWGIPFADALRMGSLTPATLIGEDHRKGSIAEGKDADFIITDDSLEIIDVYLRGSKFS